MLAEIYVRKSQHFSNPRIIKWQPECLFCKGEMLDIQRKSSQCDPWDTLDSVRGCTRCGWHMAWRCEVAVLGPKQIENTRYYAAVASLREFDVSDVNAPLDELGSYLLAKSQARLDVHPRRMEELVASIFSNDGWDVSVTAYSKDGGIDVFLERGTERIGVQVKRYKHVIGVEQVRSLVGALVEHGE